MPLKRLVPAAIALLLQIAPSASAEPSSPVPAWARGYRSPLVLTIVADRVVNGFPAPGLAPDSIDPTAPNVPTQSNGASYTAYKSEFRRIRVGNRDILKTLARGGILPGGDIRGWSLAMIYSPLMLSAPYAVHASHPPIHLGALLSLDTAECQVTRTGRTWASFTEYVAYGGYSQINRSDINLAFALPEAPPDLATLRFSASGFLVEKADYDNRLVPYEWGYLRLWKPVDFHSESMPGRLMLDDPDPRFSERMFARISLSHGAVQRVSDLRTRFSEVVNAEPPPWHQLSQTSLP